MVNLILLIALLFPTSIQSDGGHFDVRSPAFDFSVWETTMDGIDFPYWVFLQAPNCHTVLAMADLTGIWDLPFMGLTYNPHGEFLALFFGPQLGHDSEEICFDG